MLNLPTKLHSMHLSLWCGAFCTNMNTDGIYTIWIHCSFNKNTNEEIICH